MDKVKAVVRAELLKSTALKALIGERIYPSFSEIESNPTYPLITLAYTNGLTEINGISYVVTLKVDVWCRGTNDDLWAIYEEVRKVLNNKQFFVVGDNAKTLCGCRETYVNDDLYEQGLMLNHLASRYRITEIKGGIRL